MPPPRPSFSFLTTAYRTEDVVGRAIDSVLAQTRSDWEMVVVDNGRSEAMRAAVAPYLADPRVQLLRQENRGAAGGIATAAAAAVGDWYVVLNSDDLVEPGFARRMCEAIEAHPRAAAVACDATLVGSGARGRDPGYLRTAGLRGPVAFSRPLRVADVVDGPCPYYTAAIRRDVWESSGGMASLRPDTTRVNDLDFWLRILTAGHEVWMLPDRLARFRIEAGSVSRPGDDAAAEEFEEQLDASLARAVERTGAARDRAALERVRRRRGHVRAVRRARAALRAGDTAGAAEHLRVAVRHRVTPRSLLGRVLLRVAPGPVATAYRLLRRGPAGRAAPGDRP